MHKERYSKMDYIGNLNIRAVKIRVRGRVEGPSFNSGAVAEAQRLGVRGFVRTLPDGSVYAEAEGNARAVSSLLGWCLRGTKDAYVRLVAVEDQTLQGHVGFSIQHN